MNFDIDTMQSYDLLKYDQFKKLDKNIVEDVLTCLAKRNFLIESKFFLESFQFLYTKPMQNRIFYSKITELMTNSGFIELISNILKKINQLQLLKEDSIIRDIFNIICFVIISYADENIYFRTCSSKLELIETLVVIITNEENWQNEFGKESVFNAIRALYNVVRLENEFRRYKDLRIASILIEKMSKITCERTRVCAVLSLGWTLDDIEKVQNLIKDFKDGIVFAFSLLEKALNTGNNNEEFMFRCFLGEYNRLPYYCAYEIADGIARLAKNETILSYLANNIFMLNLLIRLYLVGNLTEKESASHAILLLTFNRKLLESIANHPLFLNQIKCDLKLDNDFIKLNITQIVYRVVFHPDLHSLDYLKFEHTLAVKNLQKNLYYLQTELDTIKSIYREFKNRTLFMNHQESFQREIKANINYNNINQRAINALDEKRVVVLNVILMKLQRYFQSLTENYCSSQNEVEKSVSRCFNELEIIQQIIFPNNKEFQAFVNFLIEDDNQDYVLKKISTLLTKSIVYRFKDLLYLSNSSGFVSGSF